MLDIGCGWAELLLRVLEAAPDAIGEGVDLDADAIAHGQGLADARSLTDRVDLRVSDAGDLQGGWDRVICIGASQVWGAPVEELQPLPYAAALAARRGLLPRGCRLVYGDGIWTRPPTRAAVAPAGRARRRVRDLGEVADLAVAAGFAPLAVHEASLDEWDVFESGLRRRLARPGGWGSTPPTTPRPPRCACSPSASGRRTSRATAACWAWATWSCWPSRAGRAPR